MRLISPAFDEGNPIPRRFGFCAPDPDTRVTFGDNRNPPLEWSDVPEGVKSFAITIVDGNAPSKELANTEGDEIPADASRSDFAHWLIADLDAERRAVDEAEFSQGVTPRGKQGLSGGPVEGVNDYTDWFEGDAEMEGTYRGYDGPCPPWNDSVAHRYTFTVHALDTASLDLPDEFGLGDLEAAIEGHVLGRAAMTGTYTLNPRLFQE